MEVMSQRPMYSTYGDLNIPTPGPFIESQDHSISCDVTELEVEGLSLVARPSTPLPPNVSDAESDSDSDDDYSAIYSSSQISNHFSRRELEAMGIYPNDNEQGLANGFMDEALEEILNGGSDDTSENDYNIDLEEDENSD